MCAKCKSDHHTDPSAATTIFRTHEAQTPLDAIFGSEAPAPLHDTPQFGAYIRRPIECAVTMMDNSEDAATVRIAMVGALTREHLHQVVSRK